MKRAIDETNRRRELQHKFNVEHGITPQTIKHNVENTLEITKKEEKQFTKNQLPKQIENVRKQMQQAANNLDFERAIVLRDELNRLEKQLKKYEK